jgi:hypothetical protein
MNGLRFPGLAILSAQSRLQRSRRMRRGQAFEPVAYFSARLSLDFARHDKREWRNRNESSSQTNPTPRSAFTGGRRLPHPGIGIRRNSQRWSSALRHRRRRCRRRALGEGLAVPAGGTPLRIVPSKICARDSSACVRCACGVAGAGDDRPNTVRAGGHFTKPAGTSTLRQRRRSSLSRQTDQTPRAGYETKTGLERVG